MDAITERDRRCRMVCIYWLHYLNNSLLLVLFIDCVPVKIYGWAIPTAELEARWWCKEISPSLFSRSSSLDALKNTGKSLVIGCDGLISFLAGNTRVVSRWDLDSLKASISAHRLTAQATGRVNIAKLYRWGRSPWVMSWDLERTCSCYQRVYQLVQ